MLNSFKKYLLTTVPKLVIKNNYLAELNETQESRFAGDQYVIAKLKIDTFQSHSSFSKKVLLLSGLTDLSEIDKMEHDKELIPLKWREAVLEAQRTVVISEYEELNDYYRMIAGLPAIGQDPILIPVDFLENEYGYIQPEEDKLNGIISLPLHLLDQAYLNAMEIDGVLKMYHKAYPDHDYIPYLGERKIDIATARRAEHFSLLYVPRLDQAYRFYRDFIFYYEECREYFMNVVYNFNYRNIYDYYDGFIGFMILHMTIQRMISSLFKVLVDRDFYDLETVRVFLASYSIPFVELFTMNQQKLLVKNLNILLRRKASTRVFYDILELLGYNNFDLLKYVLVKQHIMIQKDDESLPKPVFIYKSYVDELGNPILILDYSSMYQYYFVGVEMDETDIRIPHEGDSTAYSYDELTEGDSTWIKDNELAQALDDITMNYIETKYAKVRLTIRIQEMMFELVYLGRMLLDKKHDTSKIFIDIPLITSAPASLYHIQLLLICLMCKRLGMQSTLLSSPSQILYVYGFDFTDDLNKIKKDIAANKKLQGSEVSKYLETIIMRTPQDVNRMYGNIKGLYKFLEKAMQLTTDPDVYHAYKKLYDTLMIMEYESEVYAVNGVIPKTYLEVLEHENYALYDFITNLKASEDCIDYINYIATKLTTLLDNTEYLSYLNPVDTYIVEGILKILRAFKSFTLDIKGMETIYLFDSRLQNMIKMMDKGWMKVDLKTGDEFVRYSDADYLYQGTIRLPNDTMKESDTYQSVAWLNPKKDTVLMDVYDKGSGLEEIGIVKDNYHMNYSDSAHSNPTLRPKDGMRMNDRKGLQFIWEE